MSDHVTRPSHDDEATVGTLLQADQVSWMSHWIKTSSKPASMVNNKSLLLSLKEENVDQKSLVHDGLVMEDDFPKYSEGATQDIEEIATRMTTEKGKISNTPFPTLSLCQNTENTLSLRTQTDHKKEDLVVRDFDLMPENDLSNSCKKQKHIVVPHGQSNNTNGDASSPIVVFRRHFSNDNFTCLGESHSKYQKLSMNKNFLPFLLKQQSEDTQGHSHTGLFPCQRSLSDIDQQKLYHGCQPLDRVPCSVRNVETMKICAMVDSVENSRAHHALFTKETCVNISEGCQVFREPPLPTHCKEKITDSSFSLSPDIGSSRPQGVMIQPLWTTSDSEEKGNTGNPSTSIVGSRKDSSLKADDTQIDVPTNGYIQLGMASSPLKKDDGEDENIPPTDTGSSREITRNKRPITEIPDINEGLPGLQPAGSATDNMEPCASRVHSLNAKQLFPCAKQTSRSESNTRENLPVCSETSNRWIKRLKLNSSDSFGVGTESSDMGEASSHKKSNLFFNKALLSKHHGKEQMASNEFSTSSMGSKKRNQTILGSSWIQRWCQHPAGPSVRGDPEPALICEPHSLKLGVDELGKKQFPSIAAMALMGKAMNGFRPCELRKRGSIVVWKTKEY